MAYSVYTHTTPNGKIYVGITSREPKQRWQSGYGYIENEHFFRAIKKYGWNNIKHEIVADNLSKEDACKMEVELIAKYDSSNFEKGYNKSTGGEHPGTGTKRVFSAETRKKMSESAKAQHRHLTPEQVKALQGARREYRKIHPFVMSDAQKKQISEFHKGKKLSPEHIQKLKERKPWHAGTHGLFHITKEHHDKMQAASVEAKRKDVIKVETGEIYPSISNAARENGISFQNISKVCHGERNTAGGFHWSFVEVAR